MAFIASFDCLRFGPDLMGNRNIIIDFCMTLYASDICYMRSLIREPVMLLDQVYLFTVSKKLKTVKVRVATETNSIIIGYGLFQISAVPYADPVAVRVMAFPA